MNLKLKAKIVEKYRTQSRFAVCCGRNDNWISRIINGIQLPAEQEKRLIGTKLNIDPKSLDSYFEYYVGNNPS